MAPSCLAVFSNSTISRIGFREFEQEAKVIRPLLRNTLVFYVIDVPRARTG